MFLRLTFNEAQWGMHLSLTRNKPHCDDEYASTSNTALATPLKNHAFKIAIFTIAIAGLNNAIFLKCKGLALPVETCIIAVMKKETQSRFLLLAF